jgi:hypothetical protein
MRNLWTGIKVPYNASVLINISLLIVIGLPSNAESELKISAKAQPISLSSDAENFAFYVNAGPFWKNNLTWKMYLQVSTESFVVPYEKRSSWLSDYWIVSVDGILQKNKGEKFTIGPLVSLKMFDEFNITYNGYKKGNWIGLLLGPGILYNLNLKKGNVFSGRTCVSAPVAKWCYFNKDEDSASWIDTTGFSDEYHYSDSYLQNLKDNAKEYDRYNFPIYWTFSYTKYADWIFVGGGLNGLIKFQYNKVEKFNYDYLFSTFFHFGVTIKRKAKVKAE